MLRPGFEKTTRRVSLESSLAALTRNARLLSPGCLMLSLLQTMCGWVRCGGVQAHGGGTISILWSLRLEQLTVLILTSLRRMSKFGLDGSTRGLSMLFL